MHGEMRNAYKLSVTKPEGRTRHRCEDNIKVSLKETGHGLD
jgi:hypothetical protein